MRGTPEVDSPHPARSELRPEPTRVVDSAELLGGGQILKYGVHVDLRVQSSAADDVMTEVESVIDH